MSIGILCYNCGIFHLPAPCAEELVQCALCNNLAHQSIWCPLSVKHFDPAHEYWALCHNCFGWHLPFACEFELHQCKQCGYAGHLEAVCPVNSTKHDEQADKGTKRQRTNTSGVDRDTFTGQDGFVEPLSLDKIRKIKLAATKNALALIKAGYSPGEILSEGFAGATLQDVVGAYPIPRGVVTAPNTPASIIPPFNSSSLLVGSDVNQILHNQHLPGLGLGQMNQPIGTGRSTVVLHPHASSVGNTTIMGASPPMATTSMAFKNPLIPIPAKSEQYFQGFPQSGGISQIQNLYATGHEQGSLIYSGDHRRGAAVHSSGQNVRALGFDQSRLANAGNPFQNMVPRPSSSHQQDTPADTKFEKVNSATLDQTADHEYLTDQQAIKSPSTVQPDTNTQETTAEHDLLHELQQAAFDGGPQPEGAVWCVDCDHWRKACRHLIAAGKVRNRNWGRTATTATNRPSQNDDGGGGASQEA